MGLVPAQIDSVEEICNLLPLLVIKKEEKDHMLHNVLQFYKCIMNLKAHACIYILWAIIRSFLVWPFLHQDGSLSAVQARDNEFESQIFSVISYHFSR